ncbi:MAG: HAD family hydrolase [Myxococcales bacterium]|nr:HAD family hydrolase [Myxococcales bacterium]
MISRFASQRLDPTRRTELFERLVARSAERVDGRTPLLVFDLDGTLLDNRPRVVAILRELADHWETRAPDAARMARCATATGIRYGFVENLKHLGIDDPELHLDGFRFWRARFFDDAYLRHDIEVPGARSFVVRCYEAGAAVMYLTGRDLPKMALGSFASLRDLGFPIGVVGTSLVTKPRFEIPDDEFKSSVASQLERVGPVIGVFDNEPANCNVLLAAHPAAASVLLDTQHAPEPPELLPGVHVVESFVF